MSVDAGLKQLKVISGGEDGVVEGSSQLSGSFLKFACYINVNEKRDDAFYLLVF